MAETVRFEVITAVTMKNAVFWDVAPCRYIVNQCSGGTYHPHLQGIRKQVAVDYSCPQLPAHAGSLLVNFLYPEDGIYTRRHIPEDGILQF
jgi:hypothetical protein